MMAGREMIFAVVITAVAASLLLDILGFVFHTLPNFLRQAKIKETTMKERLETTDSGMLANVLDDMQSLGLIELRPDADRKPVIRKPPAEDHNMSKKAAAA
jgi:hypothetical protein